MPYGLIVAREKTLEAGHSVLVTDGQAPHARSHARVAHQLECDLTGMLTRRRFVRQFRAIGVEKRPFAVLEVEVITRHSCLALSSCEGWTIAGCQGKRIRPRSLACSFANSMRRTAISLVTMSLVTMSREASKTGPAA